MDSRALRPAKAAYDLHNHSDRSKDGGATPETIVDLAADRGVEGLGVCDHDVFPDDRLHAHAASKGIRLAQGVEISCRGAHILGYGLDATSPALDPLRERFARLEANSPRVTRRILDGLRQHGIRIDSDTLAAYSRKPPQKVFLLRYLVEKSRLFGSWGDARRFLYEKGLAIPDDDGLAPLHPATAIQMVHGAGGLAVWAHPYLTPQPLRATYQKVLLEAGLDGVEAVYPYAENGYPGHEGNQELERQTRAWAEAHGLTVFGGSDSHYPIKTSDGTRPILPGDYGLSSEEGQALSHLFR